jgi:hypothetical protein
MRVSPPGQAIEFNGNRDMKTLRCFISIMLLASPLGALAQEPPAELANLREQFQTRVEAQVEPLRRVYIEELGKLEKRLAQQGKLEDALVVKKERESFEALRRKPGELAKANNKEDLAAALENTTWSYVADVPEKREETYYVILLEGGRAYFSWDSSFGTWKATAVNRVELDHRARAGKSEMKVSPDLSTWEGGYSLDAFKRAGRRVGAPDPR